MWKYAWREIIRRKGRSTAAIFSYALATVVFSVLISLLQYSEHSQYRTLYNTGKHFIVFSPIDCKLPLLNEETQEVFWTNGSHSAIMPLHLIDTIKALPSVRDASPLLMFRFADNLPGSEVIVSGFDLENNISIASTICSTTDLVSGRFIAHDDTNAVMVEESYALSHKITAGKSVKIAGTSFQVIGIINAGIRPAKADIYMPFRQAEQLISRRTWNPIKDKMNSILVESNSAQLHKQAVQEVITLLGKDQIVSSYSCHTPATDSININKRLLWFGIVFVTMFVAVHVFRNHYASVIERRREIGVLQSIGWQQKRITRVIGYEYILQALLGGVLGQYLAIIVQISLPASESSCHILCAIDSFGIMLIGFGVIFFIASVSALMFAFCFARSLPITNLNTA
jgi:putative ABC transport system permease protein